MTYWRDILECPGYRASDEGEILQVETGRLKKQRSAGNGALQVDIRGKTYMVHMLIAWAFHGHPPKGFRVKHRNRNLSDNRPENLLWTGAPVPTTQSPTLASDLEAEYDRVRLERLSMVELMQT